MFISMAYAQEAASEAADILNDAPSPASAFAWNMGLIVILVVMFYILLIRPQQKRFQAHKEMLDSLKKGDKVVTAGGLVGKVDKMKGDDEVVVDLGGGTKVTALRSTIQNIMDKDSSSNDDEEKPAKKKATKKKASKKSEAKEESAA